MNMIDPVHEALSQAIVPLVFTASRWTGLSLPVLQGRDLRLGNLLRASQDQDPGLLMLSGSEAFPSRASCPKGGLLSLFLLSPSPPPSPPRKPGGEVQTPTSLSPGDAPSLLPEGSSRGWCGGPCGQSAPGLNL